MQHVIINNSTISDPGGVKCEDVESKREPDITVRLSADYLLIILSLSKPSGQGDLLVCKHVLLKKDKKEKCTFMIPESRKCEERSTFYFLYK